MAEPFDTNENIFFIQLVACRSVCLIKTHTSEREILKFVHEHILCGCPSIKKSTNKKKFIFFITRIVYSLCCPFLLLRLFVFLYKIHQQSICTCGDTHVKLCSHGARLKANLLGHSQRDRISFVRTDGF